jgi:cytochrome P450
VGTLEHKIRDLHEKYGHIIRLAPNKLSFTTSAAYKDIHGYGRNQLIKDPTIQGVVTKGITDLGIIQANNVNHARIRRQLSHAFSERALREQEDIIQGYVDTLISQLGVFADSGDKVDIMHKYMYCTSDITSELAFGTSFNSLNEEKLRPFVHLQDNLGGFITGGRLVARFPLLSPIITRSIPQQLMTMMKTNRQWVQDVVNHRLSQGVMEEKKDFMSYILKHKDEDAAMTEGEIRETSRTLILAGAETTRTILTMVTYCLLKSPERMKKAQAEVRSAFSSDQEINFAGASQKLPYMLACLDESMRLHTPVPSQIMGRVTPADGPMSIAGHVLPPSTFVIVHPLSTLTSSRNFKDPLAFRPERWLATKGDGSGFDGDDRFASQPFSYGPRNCIGKNLAYSKLRLILARVLWNFDLELCSESDGWDQQKIKIFWQGKPLLIRLKRRAT